MAKEDRRILGNAVAKNNRDTKNNIRDSRIITGNKNFLNRKSTLLNHMGFIDQRVSVTHETLGVLPVQKLLRIDTSIISCYHTTDEITLFYWTIPANTLRVNDMFRAKAYGIISNNTPGDQMTFTLKKGASTIHAFAASPVATLTNDPWHWDFWMGIRQIGSSAIGPYYTDVDIHGTSTWDDNNMGNLAFDSRIDNTFSLTGTWDNASSALYNQIGFVELLN